MNNAIYSDVYFRDEVHFHDEGNDERLEKFGIVINQFQPDSIIIRKGFVIVNKSMADNIKKGICSNLPGRHMLEQFTIFMYENGVTMNSEEFKEFEFEIFRILIGNGIIKTITPSKMIKAYKAIKKHGLRALLGAVYYNRSKNIRAWRCLTCKNLRSDENGLCICKGHEYPVPEGLDSKEIPYLYPDAYSYGGVMYSSVLNEVPKRCGSSKPRIKTRLTKSVVYELDDQIEVIRRVMNIDVE